VAERDAPCNSHVESPGLRNAVGHRLGRSKLIDDHCRHSSRLYSSGQLKLDEMITNRYFDRTKYRTARGHDAGNGDQRIVTFETDYDARMSSRGLGSDGVKDTRKLIVVGRDRGVTDGALCARASATTPFRGDSTAER